MIYPYIRVSTDEQAESGNGLDAQRDSVSKSIAKIGIDSVSPTVDGGTSAALALDKRPILLELLSKLKKGDILLVSKRDRLSRGDPVAMAFIERMVARKKAKIVSAAGEGTDGDSPSDVLFRRIIDAFGEYERAIIAMRTMMALQAKRARGELAGNTPYGWSAVEIPGKTTKRGKPSKRLEEIPEEQAAIQLMKKLRAAGASYRAVAAALHAEGVEPRGEGEWHPYTIKKICHPLNRQ